MKLLPQISHLCDFSNPEWTSFACSLNLNGMLKDFPQVSHLCGFFPVCLISWHLKLDFSENLLSQVVHANGFSPLWILWWLFKWCDCLNDLPQVLHSNGFSPVWILACTFRQFKSLKHFPHVEHSNILVSPVWIISCTFKYLSCLKHFPHVLHSNDFILLWVSRCPIKIAFRPKLLSQVSHLNVFSDFNQFVAQKFVLIKITLVYASKRSANVACTCTYCM